MQNYRNWLENQMQVVQAQLILDVNRQQLIIKTSQGDFDLMLTPQQVNDLTQKMGSMQVAQNPDNSPSIAYQGVQQAQ